MKMTPQANDVMCGRGADARNHVGNKRFRMQISLHCEAYAKASKSEKTKITRMIVDSVARDSGRFLKKDPTTGEWYEIDDRSSREKTGQSLREMAASKVTKKPGAKSGLPCSERGTLARLQEHVFSKLVEINRSSGGSSDANIHIVEDTDSTS